MIDELLTLPGLVALIPLLAAAAVALVRPPALGAWVTIAASTAAFVLACLLPRELRTGSLLLVDPLAAYMTILTAFVGMTTAWFSRGYTAAEAAAGRLVGQRRRHYHALYLAFLGFMLLALLSNNLGVTWVAIEAATIAGVLVVSLPRTAEAVEAAWKFFILCGVGIALALFGTIVLYLAALPALGPGLPAMSWNTLGRAAPKARGTLLNLAFVFMLIGYGTKAAMAPLHGWMADAHAEGPTPVSAVLSGSILNVALVVILRLRSLLAANAEAIAPGPPIMALGLLSLLLAAFALWRRRDVKRFFAFSTVEQSGIAAFAFGLGGAAAVFAGLLHITLHTLVKSAVFQCVGRAAQLKGGQKFADIGGLLAGHRALGLTLAAGIAGIAGLPPFGVFTSEFLVISSTFARAPILAILFVFGLLVSFGALFLRVSSVAFGEPRGPAGPVTASYLPMFAHLTLVLIAGIWLPGPLVAWFQHVAALLG